MPAPIPGWDGDPGFYILPLTPGWNGDPGFWIVPLPMPPQRDGDPGIFIIIGSWNGDPGMIINPFGVEDVLRQAGIDVATPTAATAAQ